MEVGRKIVRTTRNGLAVIGGVVVVGGLASTYTLFKLKNPSYAKKITSKDTLVALVDLRGEIGPSDTFTTHLNVEGVGPQLEAGFSHPMVKAVALQINSPGGTPASSSLLYKKIRQLSEQHNKPVYAFIEDVGASGGYMVACAADEIYADEHSTVGSIGVLTMDVSAVKMLETIGLEARFLTAGEKKLPNDPLKPFTDEREADIREYLEAHHELFKDRVRERRKGKITDEKKVFSGKVYLGVNAVDAGLTDGVGDVLTVIRQKYGEDVLFAQFRPSGLSRLLQQAGVRMGTSVGTSMGNSMWSSMTTSLHHNPRQVRL